MARQQVILDVDTGVDDALAIMLALRSPELEVVGITTVCGNVGVRQATANTLHVLDVLGAPALPVVAGAAAPLAGPSRPAADVHGEDGLGGWTRRRPPSSRPWAAGAPEFLLAMLGARPDEIVLVATGPLTNVAAAIRKDPAGMQRLRGITVMGGAVRVPGNVTAVAEFNVWSDPEAAAAVLAAGLPLTLVPLDVTEQVTLTQRGVERAAGCGPLSAFVAAITAGTIDFHRRAEGVEGMFLHDPLAVATVADPSLVRRESIPLAVECTGGLTAGMLVPDRRRRRCGGGSQVCTGVDAERFLRLFTTRVLEATGC